MPIRVPVRQTLPQQRDLVVVRRDDEDVAEREWARRAVHLGQFRPEQPAHLGEDRVRLLRRLAPVARVLDREEAQAGAERRSPGARSREPS